MVSYSGENFQDVIIISSFCAWAQLGSMTGQQVILATSQLQGLWVDPDLRLLLQAIPKFGTTTHRTSYSTVISCQVLPRFSLCVLMSRHASKPKALLQQHLGPTVQGVRWVLLLFLVPYFQVFKLFSKSHNLPVVCDALSFSCIKKIAWHSYYIEWCQHYTIHCLCLTEFTHLCPVLFFLIYFITSRNTGRA